MSMQDTLESLLSQFKNLAKSETVFGDPIVAGEVTIIPVSRISFGFAAGGSGKKEGHTGTGGGVNIIPVALISINGNKVNVHSIEKNPSDISRLVSLAPAILEKFMNSGKKEKSDK